MLRCTFDFSDAVRPSAVTKVNMLVIIHKSGAASKTTFLLLSGQTEDR